MKLAAYCILQAEALEFKGIKGDGRNPYIGYFFTDKEVAREQLRGLLMQIKRDQSIGWRSKDNLDPKKKLDFYISKVIIEVNEKPIKKRGWKVS